jgi:hypothetical protein
MTSMKVEISVNGGQPVVPANCPVCDSTFKTKNFDYNYVGSTGGSTGTEVWTFTIIDEKANETSKSITITNFGTGGASLVEIEQDNDGKTLKVYNFQGPNSGAYDLKVGGNLFSADSNSSKDIQDSTTTAEITTWPARWTSRNGTMFKKMTNYNWANVTNSAHLLAAWNDVAGGGSLIILVKKGDVYVAKLRGLDEYVLIEITDVVSTSVDNTDYVQFRFKKKDQ